MPELPEVQTTVNDLLKLDIIGQSIDAVKVTCPAVAGFASNHSLTRRFRRKKITNIQRRGKYIVFEFNDDRRSLIHLRMSGRLNHTRAGDLVLKHEHLRLIFANNTELRLHDPRKFGRFIFGNAAKDKLLRLGIDPLNKNFTYSCLSAILLNRRRQLKPLLLDQSVIAGLGNISVDEVLWCSRLHPKRPSASVREAEINALRSAITTFLKSAIARGGTSLGDGLHNFVSVSKRKGNNKPTLQVYGKPGQPCPNCAKPITRIVVAQRGTYLCPHCQKYPL